VYESKINWPFSPSPHLKTRISLRKLAQWHRLEN